MSRGSLRPTLAAALLLTSLGAAAPAAEEGFDSGLLRELRWRGIGPFRGGRTKAATGVPGKPGLFYTGVVNGGVWKTTDYGRSWQPIFDDQPTGSIGAIAVAPSNPDVIYVGSGEGMQRPDLSTGDGVYKTTDGGRSWQALGLRDAQRLFVAALGHPYGPNAERGIFCSTDGGATFQKVLYRDVDTGAADVALDPRDPDTVYAVLWEARQRPWENGQFAGAGSGLHSRRTVVRPGGPSPRACRRSSRASGASASPSRRASLAACMPPWRPAISQGSTVPTMRARRGHA